MQLVDNHDFPRFRRVAKRRLLGPIFNCINGNADDVVTLADNTRAFDCCDPLPSATA